MQLYSRWSVNICYSKNFMPTGHDGAHLYSQHTKAEAGLTLWIWDQLSLHSEKLSIYWTCGHFRGRGQDYQKCKVILCLVTIWRPAWDIHGTVFQNRTIKRWGGRPLKLCLYFTIVGYYNFSFFVIVLLSTYFKKWLCCSGPFNLKS